VAPFPVNYSAKFRISYYCSLINLNMFVSIHWASCQGISADWLD